jgi:starch synthase
MDPMKICYLTSEIHPFSKTGGLADVSAALPRYLAARGQDVRVFTPLYSKIETKNHEFRLDEHLRNIPLRVGSTTVTFSIVRAKLPGSDLDVRFVDCAPLYRRPGIYTGEIDDAVRFGMLSRAAIECCQRMGWAPDVFHAHDWHAALTPLYLRTVYSWDRLFQRCRSALSVHNFGYQGVFRLDDRRSGSYERQASLLQGGPRRGRSTS